MLNEAEKIKKSSLKQIGLMVMCIFLCGVVLVNMVVFTIAPCMFKIVFDESIIKITPYIESREVDLLKSNWILMDSYEDYKQIDNVITSAIESNGLNQKENQ